MLELQINKVRLNLINFAFFVIFIVAMIFVFLLNDFSVGICYKYCQDVYSTTDIAYRIGSCSCGINRTTIGARYLKNVLGDNRTIEQICGELYGATRNP